MSQSLKFKILMECSSREELSDYILPFWFVEEQEDLPSDFEQFIVRSALKSENSETLNSGVGLSLGSIQTQKDYTEAIKKLMNQDNLDFLLLQPFFEHDIHLTIFLTTNFVFIESQSTGESKFYFYNDLTSSKLPHWGKKVQDVLTRFNALYKGEFLIEAGLRADEFKLFQMNRLKQNHIKNALYNQVLSKALLGNKRIDQDSFFSKLKLEYKAYKFRQKETYNDFNDTFNNWVYIFFYFKLFCTKENLQFSGSSFEEFLNIAGGAGVLSKNLKRHLEICSLTDKANQWNIDSGFHDKEEIYIGHGKIEGIVDQNVLVSTNLTMEEILLHKPSVILTTYNSILSHPILFCAENGISLVGGLPKSSVQELRPGDKFSIDFKLKQIIVESK